MGQRLRARLAAVLVLVALALPGAGTLAVAAPVTQAAVAAHVAASAAPGVGGELHRNVTRTERSLARFAWLLANVALLWLQIALSIVLFLAAAAFASVADLRMFDLRRQGPGAIGRYLGQGVRTFFRILRDRRTPYLARGLLGAALLYWLVPLDLVDDSFLPPGLLDDLVLAAAAGKGFIYLCPDSLIQVHAAAVRARARA
jgi:uncharacterized membrane protein YkvA (DUF1232 family)